MSGRTGNGSATTPVAVNIVHTYKGDLKVDLVAPDGSVYVLHNRTGGSADNIVQTFTVNLSERSAERHLEPARERQCRRRRRLHQQLERHVLMFRYGLHRRDKETPARVGVSLLAVTSVAKTMLRYRRCAHVIARIG